jgi:ABC-type glutathione transport system ATPase component
MPGDAFLSVRGLSKSYARKGLLGARETLGAAREVSFDLARGHALGLVGASGSGKSTVARCLALFEAPDAGEARLDGVDLLGATGAARRGLRAAVQMVFQQPAATLNPRFTAEEIVSEPLLIQRTGTAETRRRRAAELMELTGLPTGAAGKRALEFSGGERQRLALARALALEPKLLILDESLTGLDLSIQAQIVNLLADLRRRLSLTLILISHDLGLVCRIVDELAVMDAGRLVEHGGARAVLAAPRHERTRELVAATAALAPGGAL